MLFREGALQGGQVVPAHSFRPSSPEVGRTLLRAGLYAITGAWFPISGAGLPERDQPSFREALLARAVREKLVPMLAESSKVEELGLNAPLVALTSVYRLIAREAYSRLPPVLADLSADGIVVAVIKGADLDLSVYRQSFPRVMGDIDLLVRPSDSEAASRVFRAHGFVHGRLDKTRGELVEMSAAEKAQFEAGSIELAEFAKLVPVPDLVPYQAVIEEHLAYWRMAPLRDSYYLVIGYDVHTHLSLELELEDVWSSLRPFEFSGFEGCMAQSFTDLAWYLSTRFYQEHFLKGAFVMRGFLDVLAIVHRRHLEIDWERLERVAAKYGFQPALFYTFWHIRELLGDLVPARLLEALAPSLAANDRRHDWGDFMPRFLGGAQCYPLLNEDSSWEPGR